MTPETISDLEPEWKPRRAKQKIPVPKSSSEAAKMRWDTTRMMRAYCEGLSALLKSENFYGEQLAKLQHELSHVKSWLRQNDTKH